MSDVLGLELHADRCSMVSDDSWNVTSPTTGPQRHLGSRSSPYRQSVAHRNDRLERRNGQQSRPAA